MNSIQTMTKTIKIKPKIGLLTFHNAVNYGALLQCYALQTYLEENLEANVEIINFTPYVFRKMFFDKAKPLSAPGFKNKFKSVLRYFLKYREVKKESLKRTRLLDFAKNYFHLTGVIDNVLKIDGNDYDLVVVGSDQVWNLKLLNGEKSFFLENNSVKKVSYAASFKIDDIDEICLNTFLKCLPRFYAVSVREDDSSAFLTKIGISNVSLLDPTLLLDESQWLKMISKRKIQSRYILIYHVNPPKKMIECAFEYADKHGLKVVSLNHLRLSKKRYIDLSDSSVEDFLSLIYYSDCVFTTSFHGMAFSIIFEKEFYFETPNGSANNNQRLVNLSNKLGIADRQIEHCFEEKKIDWARVSSNLISQKNKAFSFLRKCLSIKHE